MLYYGLLALKEVLGREDLNETNIYFFTYDEVVQEYDFSGEEVRCTVIDPSIKEFSPKSIDNSLQNIRVA